MSQKACVVGVGMIPFKKPGASGTYIEMGAEATRAALADAGLGYDKLQQAYAGYVYGGSTSGQSALYEVGITGIPIINVNNNCSTGSTAGSLWAVRARPTRRLARSTCSASLNRTTSAARC